MKLIKKILFTVTFSLSTTLNANPVICFNSSQGDFCLELFEKQAPLTVENFLKYIDNNNYQNSIVHRSMPDFIIQMGGLKILATETSNEIVTPETLDPIINEFAISNTRGTIAMAKIDGNPDSATNQWFVNLNDNNAENLDNQNGGFTVFGQVIQGMQVFDTIATLPTYNISGLNSAMTDTPLIDFQVENAVATNNLVLIFPTTITPNNPESSYQQGVLQFPVNIGNDNFYDARLNLIETEPHIVFELDLSHLTKLETPAYNAALFSAEEKTLSTPSVLIDGKNLMTNVKMTLTDENNYQFTLEN